MATFAWRDLENPIRPRLEKDTSEYKPLCPVLDNVKRTVCPFYTGNFLHIFYVFCTLLCRDRRCESSVESTEADKTVRLPD